MHQFRLDGILLPYAASREAFDTWSSTLLQDPTLWPIRDDVDPFVGWSHEQINTGKPRASNDYLGAQYLMLEKLLTKFCKKIKTVGVRFRMYHMDCRLLPTRLSQ